jgi:hypothetical protein
MSLRVGVIGALVAVACSSKSEVKGGGHGSEGPTGPHLTIVALAEMRGQIGPCGCTSDPLGDISRTAKLIESARAAGPTLVVDAGGLLYSKNPVPPHLEAQEELKADLLASTYKDAFGVTAIGVGPSDLAKGPGKVRLPRQAVNATDPQLLLEAPKVVELGGMRVGVFGVVGLDQLDSVKVGDPIGPSKQAISTLKQQGAQVIVALVQAESKKDAVKLVRDIGGVDLAIAGLGALAPEPEAIDPAPTKVGDGWLVIPGNRGQVVSRLDVTLRGIGPLADAIGPGAAAAKTAALDKQLAGLDADLAKFAADKDADPQFVAQKRAERDALAKAKAQLAQNPLVIPPSGPYFTLDQIRIDKQLACAGPVQTDVLAFNRAAGEANVKAAAGTPRPAAPPRAATYIGGEKCDDCHADAVAFWKTTRHAHAWQTLEERGQQFDFDCIGCHVTGWERPGGSNLANTDALRDVQCETCHGPGSIHVAKGGEEKPFAVRRVPDENLCATQCHTKEHSDTFELQPYLRDITGEGHGESLRKTLGDGPTGHELRKAALDKVGRTLGAGCVR